jgi:hypothetical protein
MLLRVVLSERTAVSKNLSRPRGKDCCVSYK